jgi:hypothetical protein
MRYAYLQRAHWENFSAPQWRILFHSHGETEMSETLFQKIALTMLFITYADCYHGAQMHHTAVCLGKTWTE